MSQTEPLPRRVRLSTFFRALACLAALTLGAREASAQSAELPADYGGFVTAEGTKLKLNGGDFHFSGANSYAMIYSREQAEETMRIGKSLGLNAIRMWGFWDGEEPLIDEMGNVVEGAPGGTDRYGRQVLQSRPRQYNELAFRNFDYAIYLAHIYGMKLIIPLMNEWDEFGGIKKYLEWAGLDVPETVEGFYANEAAIKAKRFQFFQSQECKDIYFDYVQYVLNRVNTITGVAYKDDPAIMIWEVMNEPRFGPWEGDPTATQVRDFLKASAEFIKRIDKKHLVGTGEEGFLNASDVAAAGYSGYAWDAAAGEGSSFVLNSQIDAIDVLTFHGWPFNWGLGAAQYAGSVDTFMPQWVEEHARIANDIGKPLYLGEFGWQILRRDGSDLKERDEIMSLVYEAAEAEGIAGIAFWNLSERHDPESATYDGTIERTLLDSAIYTDDVVPHDQEFHFDIFCPEDGSTCGLISEHTKNFTSRVANPDPAFTSSCFAPRLICGDQCVLTDSHPEHCGACGNVCSDGLACVSGSCVERTVAPSWERSVSPYNTAAGCNAAGSGMRVESRHTWLVGMASLLLFAARRRFGRRIV